jgi:hypothetical protein
LSTSINWQVHIIHHATWYSWSSTVTAEHHPALVTPRVPLLAFTGMCDLHGKPTRQRIV